MEEELTDKMHEEFEIEEETEQRHAAYCVWILCGKDPAASREDIDRIAPTYGITGDVAYSYWSSFGEG